MSNIEIVLTSKDAISLLKKGEINTNEKEKLIHFLKQASFYPKWENIGDSGAQILADALKMNNTLTDLYLSQNEIGEAGAQALANSLKVNKTLTRLNLNKNNIGNSGTQAIADVLKTNNTLTELVLSENKIGEVGAEAIEGALKVNNTLTELHLNNNKIGDIGVQAIAGALKIDKFRVRETELTNTNIEQALKIKKVLLILNISNNEIGNKGMNAIAEMLKVNNSLQVLDISGNDFIDISKLGDALKYNRSLTNLVIKKELEKVLQFNICLLNTKDFYGYSSRLLKRNEQIQTTLSKRILECKNTHLSLLDYKIIERVNVAVIFKNVWEREQTGKTYEECLREYWELISIGFSKYFLFILGVCKLNQIPPFRTHLLGIPKEILNYIGSFLNPKDFQIVRRSSQKGRKIS